MVPFRLAQAKMQLSLDSQKFQGKISHDIFSFHKTIFDKILSWALFLKYTFISKKFGIKSMIFITKW